MDVLPEVKTDLEELKTGLASYSSTDEEAQEDFRDHWKSWSYDTLVRVQGQIDWAKNSKARDSLVPRLHGTANHLVLLRAAFDANKVEAAESTLSEIRSDFDYYIELTCPPKTVNAE